MAGKIVIAFDLYGTLLSTESIAMELAGLFGQDKAKVIAATWRKYQLEYTWRLNSMERFQSFSAVTRHSLQHALSESHVSLDSPAVNKLMEAYDSLSTFPEVRPALDDLATNNEVKCVVFSNGTNTMVSNSVQKSPELSPHASVFADIVTVEEMQLFKPAPEVYRYLARKVGMAGNEDQMWLVSSNPFDVVGARCVGMQSCWVDRAGSGWQDQLISEVRPSAVVKGIHEVASLVRDHAKKL